MAVKTNQSHTKKFRLALDLVLEVICDAPRFGLKYHLVSNGERKNVENLEKVKKCAILPSFLSETMFCKSFCLNSANSWAVAPIGNEVL